MLFFLPVMGNASSLIDLKTPIVQGSLVYGRTQPDVEVYYGDTQLVKDGDNQFVFALPQDAEDNLTLAVIQNKKHHTFSSPVQKRRWKEEVVNGLPPQKVVLSPADGQRVALENQLLRSGRTKTFYEKLPICFVRPISKKARISSEFGARRILNGIKAAGHSGTDYAMPIGTPLFAPAEGIVKVVHPDMFYSGKTVLIDHGYGIFSSYSHMNDIVVQEGEYVVQGQQIGAVGTTGRSTGPHLHFTMTWFGVRVDPEFVLTHYACDK
ncbi:MAG: M23 family metallopeptidase [Alphaproteobacteria bacterium]|nr:M23 family metallopeptidase [Alphaproteobacteria bacterium]